MLQAERTRMVVAMKKQVEASLVHRPRFGEGQRFADKTGQTLPQCIVPAFHVGGFSRVFSHSAMLVFWDHCLIGFPEIGEAVTCTIERGNGFPQPATGCLATISDRVGHNLSRLTAQCNPDPRLVCFLQHKGLQLIQF